MDLQGDYEALFKNQIITAGLALGAGNFGVIVVRVCELVFQNLPHSYS